MDSISLRNKLFKKYHTNAKMYKAVTRNKPCEFIKETLKTWTVDELKRLVNHFTCLDATKFSHIFTGIIFWMPTDEIKKILMYLEKTNKFMFDTILNSDELYCQIYSLTYSKNYYQQCIIHDWSLCLKHLDNIYEIIDEDSFGYWCERHELYDNISTYDSVKCLEYLYENYNSLVKDFQNDYLDRLIYNCAFKCLMYLKIRDNHNRHKFSLCNIAVKKGIQYLKLAYENGYKFTDKTCKYAIRANQVECLKFAHMNGCKLNEKMLLIAVQSNSIDCLQYLHSTGLKLNEELCYVAARCGSLGCFQHIHQNGCKLNEKICYIAARYGQLECFKYAHVNGCKLNEKMCYVVAKCGYLECLQYIHTSGCKYNRNMLITISHKKCIDYVVENM